MRHIKLLLFLFVISVSAFAQTSDPRTFCQYISEGKWYEIKHCFANSELHQKFLSQIADLTPGGDLKYYPYTLKKLDGNTAVLHNAALNKDITLELSFQLIEGSSRINNFIITKGKNDQNFRIEAAPYNYAVLPNDPFTDFRYLNTYLDEFNRGTTANPNETPQEALFRQVSFQPLNLKFKFCRKVLGVNVCTDGDYTKEFGLVLSDKDHPDNDDGKYDTKVMEEIRDITSFKNFLTGSDYNTSQGQRYNYVLTSVIIDGINLVIFREGLNPWTYGDGFGHIRFKNPVAVKALGGFIYVLDKGGDGIEPKIYVLEVYNTMVNESAQGGFGVNLKGIMDKSSLGGVLFDSPKDLGGYSTSTGSKLIVCDQNKLYYIPLNANGFTAGTVKSFTNIYSNNNSQPFFNLSEIVRLDARDKETSADLGSIILVGEDNIVSLTCAELENGISNGKIFYSFMTQMSGGNKPNNLAYMLAEQKWYLTDYNGKLHKLDKDGRYLGGAGNFGRSEGNNELYLPNAITPNPIGDDITNDFRYRFMVANEWGYETGIKLFSPGIFISKIKAFENLNSLTSDLTFAFTMSGKWGYVEGAQNIQLKSFFLNTNQLNPSLWGGQFDATVQTNKQTEFLNKFPETLTLNPTALTDINNQAFGLKRGWNTFTLNIEINKNFQGTPETEIITKKINFYWVPNSFSNSSSNPLGNITFNNSATPEGYSFARDFVYKPVTLTDKQVFYAPNGHDIKVYDYGILELQTGATLFNKSNGAYGLQNFEFKGNGKAKFNSGSFICAKGSGVSTNYEYALPNFTNNLILNPAYKKGINPTIVSNFSATEQAQCTSACVFLAGTVPVVTFSAEVDMTTNSPFKVTVNPAGTTYFNKLKWEVEEVGNTTKKGSFIIDATASTQVINLNEKITYNSLPYQFLSCKDYKITLSTGCNDGSGAMEWMNQVSKTIGINYPVVAGEDQFACEYDAPLQMTGFLPALNANGGTSVWTAPAGITVSTAGLVTISATAAGLKNTVVGLTYTYTDKYGCAKTATQKLTVRTRPAAPPALTINSPICERYGLTVYANQLSGASYKFVFANNEVVESDIHAIVKTATPDMNGTLKVSIKVNGCYSLDKTANIVVNPMPSFSIPEPVKNFCKTSSPFTLLVTTPVTSVYWTALSGVTASGSNLTKTGADGWDGGGFSLQSITDGGFVEATALETNKYRMLGLSSSNADNNFTNIHFALYLTNTGTIEIYERGVKKPVSNTYAANDKVKIMSTGGVIKYYKNNVLFHTSSSQPTFPLYADVSLYSTGATLKNVTMSGQGTGTWSGTGVTNVGSTYTFTPATAGIGVFDLTYSQSNSNIGCYQTAVQKMIVGPAIQLGPNETVCLNTPAFAPSVVSPTGGTWSENGTNLTGNLFNPSSKAVGTYTLTYTFTDTYGCTNTATKTITVKGSPTANISPVQPTGLRYKYYENITSTAWTSVSNMIGLPTIADGTATSVGVTPKLQNTSYGLIFEGYITVPTTGSYTFYLTSKDGSRLTVNDVVWLSHDGAHASSEKASAATTLSSGLHKIKVEYFNTTYSTTLPDVLSLQWSGPGITKQAVPASSFKAPVTFCEGSSVALTASAGSSYLWSNGATTGPVLNVSLPASYSVTVKDADGCSASSAPIAVSKLDNAVPTILTNKGLKYSYYKNPSATLWSTMPDFSTLTPNETGFASAMDLSQITMTDNMAIVYEGYINILANASYTFFVNSDDGGQLFIDDLLVIDNNGNHAAIEKSADVTLRTGLHKFKLKYYNNMGGYTLSVSYSSTSASITKQVIPSTILFNDLGKCINAPISLAPSQSGTYLWNTAATTNAIPFGANGNYSVTVTKSNGCQASVTKSVWTTSSHTANIVSSTPVTTCFETFTSSVLLASPSGIAPYKYQWQNSGGNISGATAQSLSLTLPSAYKVSITDGCGSIATSPVFDFKVVKQPDFVLGSDVVGTQDICASGGSANIRVNISNYNPASAYDVILTPGNISTTVPANSTAVVKDDFSATTLNPAWKYYRTYASGAGSYYLTGGTFQLGSNAINGIPAGNNEFDCIMRSDLSGDIDVKVHVSSVSSRDPVCVGGLLLANSILELSKGGYCLIGVSPGVLVFSYDLDGNGSLEGNQSVTLATSFAGYIRLKRTGETFSAYYSQEAVPVNWIQIGTTQTIASTKANSQTALFLSSITPRGAAATFDNFESTVTSPLINVPVYTAGTYTIEVKDKTGNNTCTTKTANITFGSKPNPTITPAPYYSYTCYNSSANKLSGDLPAGGVYSGSSIAKVGADYYFTPSVDNKGLNIINFTYTAANGCSSTINRRINVLDRTPATFDLGPNANVLQGNQISFNVPIGTGESLLWSTGETASSISVVVDNITPVKTITATLSNACGQTTDNIVLTVPCPQSYFVNAGATMTTKVLGNYDGTAKTYTGGGVFDGSYYVVSDLLLKNGTYTLNPGTVFYVEDGKKILLGDNGVATPAVATLNLNGATITAVCSKMWGGIFTNGISNVNMTEGGSPAQNSVIKDAINGLRVSGTTTYTNWLTNIDIRKTNFTNNWAGIDVDQDAKASVKIQYSKFDAVTSQMKAPYFSNYATRQITIDKALLSGFEILNNEISNFYTAISFWRTTLNVTANIKGNKFRSCAVSVRGTEIQGTLNLDQNDITVSTQGAVGIEFSTLNQSYPIGSKINITNNQLNNISPVVEGYANYGIAINMWNINYHEIKGNYLKGFTRGVYLLGENNTYPIAQNNFTNCLTGIYVLFGGTLNVVCNNFEDNAGIANDNAIEVATSGVITFKQVSGSSMEYNMFTNMTYNIRNSSSGTNNVIYHKASNDLTSAANVLNTQIITSQSGTPYGAVDCVPIAGNRPGINFDNPIDIGNVNIGTVYNNTQNNSSSNGFLHDYGMASDDIFYKFTLTEAAKVTIDHCGSSISDSYLYLFNENRTLVTSNDDSQGCGLRSVVSMNLAPGVYYIASEGYSNYTGNITTAINIQSCVSEPGQNRQNPIIVPSLDYCNKFSDLRNNLACYSNNSAAHSGPDIHYKFTLTSPLTVAVSTCNSPAYDTYLTLTDEAGTTLAFNDDNGPLCSLGRNASLTASLGVGTYYVILEPYSGYSGWMNLDIQDNSCVQVRKDFTIDKAPLDKGITEEAAESTIGLYPNPAQGMTHLRISNLKEAFELKVIDMAGQQIELINIHSAETDLNTSEWPAGTYTLSFTLNNKTMHKKLVVIK